eukprot:2122014-Amphidinium_carterae.1
MRNKTERQIQERARSLGWRETVIVCVAVLEKGRIMILIKTHYSRSSDVWQWCKPRSPTTCCLTLLVCQHSVAKVLSATMPRSAMAVDARAT